VKDHRRQPPLDGETDIGLTGDISCHDRGLEFTSPANGTAVGANQGTGWTPAAGVQRSHIEIYNNGDQMNSTFWRMFTVG
jgi:hypothetical protein